MLNRRVTRIYDEALRSHGIGVAQVNLLVAIESMGRAPTSSLVEALGLEKSTLSRNLKRLSERGWIRVWLAAEGRGQLVELSDAGRSLLEAILPDWERAQAEAAALLGAELAPVLTNVRLRPS